MKIIYLFILLCKYVLSTYNDQLISTLINIIRLEPNYYKLNFNSEYNCNLNKVNYPLYISNELNDNSYIQASYLNDLDCPISHNTCDKYCNIYNSCSYIDRVNYYCNSCELINENLIKGPKDPIKSLNAMLTSYEHCKNIFDSQINIFGVGNNKNIYVQTYAYIYNNFENKIISASYVKNITHITFYSIYNGCNSIYLQYNGTNYTMNAINKYIYTYSIIKINYTKEYYIITYDEKYNII